MRICQVTCSIYNIRTNFNDKIFDYFNIFRSKRCFFYCASLIKREIKRIDVLFFDSNRYCSRPCFDSTNQSFDIEIVSTIVFTNFSVIYLIIDTVTQLYQIFILTWCKFQEEFAHKIIETGSIMIKNCNISACLICNINFVSLINQFFHCASHTDYIIIRVRRKYQSFFRNLCLLIEVIIQRFFRTASCRPACDCVLESTKNE